MEYWIDGHRAEPMYIGGKHNEERNGMHLSFGQTDYGRDRMHACDRFQIMLIAKGQIYNILSEYQQGDADTKRAITKELMDCLDHPETMFYN